MSTLVRALLLYSVLLIDKAYTTLQTIDLNGQWVIADESRRNDSSPGKDNLSTVLGTVPGNVYTSLINNNQIDDPYYRDNDDRYRWIAKDNWSYTKSFQVTSSIFSSQSLVLVCEGLDTVSHVFINGVTVGTSDNMFVRYVFDIKKAARVGTNNLTIVFSSPVKYAESESKLYPYAVPPVALVPEYHGENHVQFIRKCQCSFSWDWGPSYPAMGIWRDIYIQGYNNAVIRDVTAETLKGKDGTWQLSIEVFVEIPHNATVNGKLEAKLDSTPVSLTVPVTFNEKNKSAVMQINIPKNVNIKEWWPNGYGNQTLYKLYTFFTGSDGQEMVGKSINIGFRTVEVVEDFVSNDHSQGTTFYFKINDQPVFFKGSNWIPADSFLDRVSKSRIENLLQSAKDANMNVLRVWGGGIYEMEEFYDIADRLGIMIWQDFMFGCSMYPTDPTFLNSVTEEVTHQVRRLKHRPSIVIWSGNNENEKALRQSWYNTDVNFTLYYNDYIKLYKDVIYKVVQKEDPNRPFIASSPANGKESMAEGWVAKMPWDEHYGDIHEYKYMDPFFMPSSYRIPRFSSEYGLQSLPSYESLNAVLKDSDMYYWSDMLEHRQHHPFGMVEMMAEVIMYLRLPNNPDKQKLFMDQIYVTQIDQAIGMKTETEHYRRWQNKLDDKGRGLTMGAMYWMLNDIWQAPTWSSLEYSGKWKMLHYFAKNFFAPLLISPTQEGNNIEVYIIVDQIPSSVHRHPQTGQVHFQPITNLFAPWNPHPQSHNKQQSNVTSGTLYIQMYSWDSLTPLHTWTQNYNLQKTTDMVFQADVDAMMSTAGCIRTKNCFLYFHLGDPVNGPTNWFSLSTFKDAIGLQNASIQIIDVKETVPMKEFNITLHSKAVAPFVWLDAYKTMGRFSDNGFLMVQTQKVVTFYAWNDISAANLKAILNVKSLMDIYF
ncbi:beta-mannosidase-like isoform X1 [Mytilus galloprovincialis]|uniref:beta-mannosidase-like isoform X1 n=1 Tax=Mytilus galloprovincialis TaxID=29158 RepID=UPI003F7B8074